MYPKRYFVVHFSQGIVQILLNENSKPFDGTKFSLLTFKDIKDCMVVSEESQKILGTASKNYKHAFYLETEHRTFELFTTSLEERCMWHAAFHFIALSNQANIAGILQEIQQALNDQKVNARIDKHINSFYHNSTQ